MESNFASYRVQGFSREVITDKHGKVISVGYAPLNPQYIFEGVTLNDGGILGYMMRQHPGLRKADKLEIVYITPLEETRGEIREQEVD